MPAVLIIEDEAPIRENLKRFLRLEGYTVLEAENGRIGLDLARTERPQLILCDVMMPKMTGFEVLAALREDADLVSIPFIFLTASADRDNIARGIELGAADYVTKPFNLLDLGALIQRRLGKSA